MWKCGSGHEGQVRTGNINLGVLLHGVLTRLGIAPQEGPPQLPGETRPFTELNEGDRK